MRAKLPKIPNIGLWLVLLAGALLGTIAFTGLHSAVSKQVAENNPVHTIAAAKTRAAADESAPAAALQASAGQPELAQTSGLKFIPPARSLRGPSQLIRTANLTLEVVDVGNALRSATLLSDEQLGDVISLNDESPASGDDPHTATMAIRVPQYRFEQMLSALGALGKVRSKSVNAQDVSDQIVDAQARLRNLRRTEADILNIMDRSGNIEQVLNVTQQLGSVREQIERLDAQIQGMQYQVAYSTINITLIKPGVISTPSGSALLAAAWKSAIGSLRDFTVSLLSLGLWLVVFSPYIIGLALVAAFVRQRMRTHALPTRGGQ